MDEDPPDLMTPKKAVANALGFLAFIVMFCVITFTALKHLAG